MIPATTRPAKRRKRSTVLVEDDVEAAEAVTHETVTEISRSGAAKVKNVLVPLVPVIENHEKTRFDASHHIDPLYFSSSEIAAADADADADADNSTSPLKPRKVISLSQARWTH
jgi:hypothetical protein